MKRTIDISTYEEWFIDHLDGALTPEEHEQLEMFLIANPYLAEELDGLSDVSLISDTSISMPSKASLKRSELEDEHIILLMEGGETDFSSLSPHEKELFKVYEKTRLIADESIHYPNAEDLKRYETKVIPLWIKAVSIAAMLMMAFFLIPTEQTPSHYTSRQPLEQFDWNIDRQPDESLFTESSNPNVTKVPQESKVIQPSNKEQDRVIVEESLFTEEIEHPKDVKQDKGSNSIDPLPIKDLNEIPVPNEDLALSPKMEVITPLEKEINSTETHQKHVPISNQLKEEKGYTSALDLLKRATSESDILAIQDVDLTDSYIETSVKFGGFELSVKRKRKK